jgi:hypothetical protein
VAFQVQQLLALRFEQAVDRDAGPFGDDFGNVGVGDLFAQ